MNSMQPLKVFFHACESEEIRRLSVQKDSKWEAIKDRLNKMFEMDDGYHVRYVDPDGDQVLISSQEEWEECLDVVGAPTTLHLHISAGQQSGTAMSSDDEETNDTEERSPWQGNTVAEVFDAFGKLIPVTMMNTYAVKLMDDGCYAKALEVLHKSCEIEVNAVNLYNMACCYALMGQQTEALTTLKKSVAKGYHNWEHMQSDKDLASLHFVPQFQEIISDLKEGKHPEAKPETQGSERSAGRGVRRRGKGWGFGYGGCCKGKGFSKGFGKGFGKGLGKGFGKGKGKDFGLCGAFSGNQDHGWSGSWADYKVQVMRQRALKQMECQDYEGALRVLKRASWIKAKAHNLYVMARCHAKLGQKAEALEALKASICNGYKDWNSLVSDPDLEVLSDEEMFTEMIKGLMDEEQNQESAQGAASSDGKASSEGGAGDGCPMLDALLPHLQQHLPEWAATLEAAAPQMQAAAEMFMGLTTNFAPQAPADTDQLSQDDSTEQPPFESESSSDSDLEVLIEEALAISKDPVSSMQTGQSPSAPTQAVAPNTTERPEQAMLALPETSTEQLAATASMGNEASEVTEDNQPSTVPEAEMLPETVVVQPAEAPSNTTVPATVIDHVATEEQQEAAAVPVEANVEDEMDVKLHKLRECGFLDEERNRKVLQECNGSVSIAINRLLEE